MKRDVVRPAFAIAQQQQQQQQQEWDYYKK